MRLAAELCSCLLISPVSFHKGHHLFPALCPSPPGVFAGCLQKSHSRELSMLGDLVCEGEVKSEDKSWTNHGVQSAPSFLLPTPTTGSQTCGIELKRTEWSRPKGVHQAMQPGGQRSNTPTQFTSSMPSGNSLTSSCLIYLTSEASVPSAPTSQGCHGASEQQAHSTWNLTNTQHLAVAVAVFLIQAKRESRS